MIFDKIYVGIVKCHFFANLQQSYDPCWRQNFVQPWTAELAALDQLKKKNLQLTSELFENTCLFSGERSLPFGLLALQTSLPLTRNMNAKIMSRRALLYIFQNIEILILVTFH